MIQVNSEILRNEMIGLMVDLQGKLHYTQDERRDDIEGGFGDCSSVVRWVYQKVLHMDIGEDTPVQITNPKGWDVDFGPYPDESKLLPGDLLFFEGGDESRPYKVGHVEMYLCPGRLVGQNGRDYPGTFVKDLKAYVEMLEKKGCRYIKARRFL